jgi:hypothetical protein
MRPGRAGMILNLVLWPALTLLPGCRTQAEDCARTYAVSRTGSLAPEIDGILAEDEWPADRWETGLAFPWRDRAAPGTAFCFLTDGAVLYFAFRATDEDVVLAEGSPEDESLVARGDRVELFLAREARLDEYYCLEIDPLGRVLDYKARFYRRFDNGWDWSDLTVAARQRPDGYDVEGCFSHRALEEMGLAVSSGTPLLVGVFRAEFSHREAESPEESWISWVRPRVEKPDFHVPSAFGCFRFPSVP